MRFQKSGICGRNILVAHGPFHAQHPTFHIHHLSSHIPHPTLHTPHSTFSTSLSACEISVPILRTGGAICVVDKHSAWFLCRSVASAGEIFLCRMAHSKSHIPHPTFHIHHLTPNISHSTSHIPYPTFHIPHSTFSTPLPKIYTLFPVAPRPASKYAILSASLQPPNNQPFIIQALPRQLPNTPFPTTKRHLSTHDPCPFEAPSLTFRTSIPKPPEPDTCPTPGHPPLTPFPPVPIPHPKPPNRASPPSVSPKIPTPHFHQISLPSALSPTAKMILRNVMGWVRTMRNTPQPEMA